MSITFDTSAKNLSNGGTYTVGAGSLPIVLVYVVGEENTQPSTVTFGGITVPQVISLPGPPSGAGSPGMYVYALTNPVQGSAQVVAFTGGNSANAIFAVVSYFGVGQVYPIYQHTQAQGDGNDTQLAITPDDVNSWVVSAGQKFDGNVPTVTGTGLTLRQSSTTSATAGSFWYDSNAAPGSLYTTTFSTTNHIFYTYASFLLSPVVPPPPPTANSASFLLNFL